MLAQRSGKRVLTAARCCSSTRPGRVDQQHRERPVQLAGRLVRLLDGGSRRSAGPSSSTSSTRWRLARAGHRPALRSTRAAASLPEISTIGTPTPGLRAGADEHHIGQCAVQVARAERAGLEKAVRGGERGAGGHARRRPSRRG